MIYTLGKCEPYDRAIERHTAVTKLVGGTVFQTLEAAETARSAMKDGNLYKVYKVDADWHRDTCECINRRPDVRCLNRSARLYPL